MNGLPLTRRLLALTMLATAGIRVDAQIDVTPSALTLTLVSVPGGSLRATNTTSSLTWRARRIDGRRDKVTVVTFCPGQRYALRVTAVRTRGTARPVGTADLMDGRPALDLIDNIWAPFSGDAELHYEATANANASAGSDFHVVTYTLTIQ